MNPATDIPRGASRSLPWHSPLLAASLAASDLVFCYSAGLKWDARPVLAPLGASAMVHDDFDGLIAAVAGAVRPGDHVVIMSNGGFGGIHQKLLALLARRF